MKILEPPSDAQTLIQRAAFQLFLARGGAIGLNDVAQHSGVRFDLVSNLVGLLDGTARIRLNAAGEVVGSDAGSHDELLQRGGLYKALYDRQFRTDSKPKRDLQLVSA